MGQERAREAEGGPEVAVEDRAEVGLVGVGEAAGAGAAEVVDEEVDRAERAEGPRGGGADAGLGGEVAREADRARAERARLGHRGVEVGAAARGEGDAAPFAGEGKRDRAADAAAAPADERRPAREPEVHATAISRAGAARER